MSASKIRNVLGHRTGKSRNWSSDTVKSRRSSQVPRLCLSLSCTCLCFLFHWLYTVNSAFEAVRANSHWQQQVTPLDSRSNSKGAPLSLNLHRQNFRLVSDYLVWLTSPPLNNHCSKGIKESELGRRVLYPLLW